MAETRLLDRLTASEPVLAAVGRLRLAQRHRRARHLRRHQPVRPRRPGSYRGGPDPARAETAPGPPLQAAALPAPAGAGLATMGRRPLLRPRRPHPGPYAGRTRRPSPATGRMPGTGAQAAGSSPAAMGAVAAARPATPAGGRVLEAASRPRRRRSGSGRLRSAARPGRRRAHPGRTTMDPSAHPGHQPATGRQPAPAPARTKPRVVGPGRRGGKSSPSSLPHEPASTTRSAASIGWPSSAAAWTPPSR